ncbi:MAG: HD family hydrolase [Pseudomonadota bacterium]
MLSGRRLNILDPSPLDIEIRDIAHGLARVARWNGQTKGPFPFSVAQHSLLVEAIVDASLPDASPSDRLAALLHDAPEYVVGDLISPFKAAIGDAYKGVEERLERAIHLRFSIPPDPSARRRNAIKQADTVAAFHEATALAGFAIKEARQIFRPPAAAMCAPAAAAPFLHPWQSAEAEARFLERFERLDAECASAEGQEARPTRSLKGS